MFPPATIQLSTGGHPVRIHLLSTGMAADKRRFREARLKGPLSTLDAILDRHWTNWMPIWVIAIEHPEGIFLIDTGERAGVNTPGYFRSSGLLASWFDSTQFKFQIQPEEEIGPQLNNLSITIKNIRSVILTHLHFDHTDGLHHFPNTPILVHRLEWQRPFGALPKLYPNDFHPTLLDLNQPYDVFPKTTFLTKSKDLLLIHTPGHTYGHCSVLLRTDTCHILFAGDICYTQDQLLQGKYAANAASHKQSQQTYTLVKQYAQHHPVVFIPSHDEHAAQRLKELQLLAPPVVSHQK